MLAISSPKKEKDKIPWNGLSSSKEGGSLPQQQIRWPWKQVKKQQISNESKLRSSKQTFIALLQYRNAFRPKSSHIHTNASSFFPKKEKKMKSHETVQHPVKKEEAYHKNKFAGHGACSLSKHPVIWWSFLEPKFAKLGVGRLSESADGCELLQPPTFATIEHNRTKM